MKTFEKKKEPLCVWEYGLKLSSCSFPKYEQVSGDESFGMYRCLRCGSVFSIGG
jgi:hypothetical protein